jgi:hypothetical protein
VSRDRKVIPREPGKVLQYQHLTREIQLICNITELKPLIIGAIGTIPKTFRQLLLLVVVIETVLQVVLAVLEVVVRVVAAAAAVVVVVVAAVVVVEEVVE